MSALFQRGHFLFVFIPGCPIPCVQIKGFVRVYFLIMEQLITNKPKPNEYWQRIEALCDYAAMTPHSLAVYIGLPHTENLYRIKRGLNGISRNLADRITQYFPEISRGWLLCGAGTMLRKNDICTF